MIEYLLPLLEGMGGSGGGLSGNAAILNALGGGKTLGSIAGTPLGYGEQGPTQGNGIMGALSGGGMGALLNEDNPLLKKDTYKPYLGAGDTGVSSGYGLEKDTYKPYLGTGNAGATSGYGFVQNRFRPVNY